MQTIEEYKDYTKQLENEVGTWHHAYDALRVERNQLVNKLMSTEKFLEAECAECDRWRKIASEQLKTREKMNNEHEHIYDDCIGNPPFAEALKTLEVGCGMNTEWKLTDAQQRFFDEKKERVSNLPEDSTDREKELAKIALFMANYAENLQGALNRLKIERKEAVERHKHNMDLSKAWGAMVACYRAIDRHFGNEIRAQLEKNDRTQKEGQMRSLMEQMQKITK